MKNPYLALPEKNFWKTGFVEKGDLSLMDLYSKKFDINKNMPIVTAGSCFAQHIGKTLEKNGFNILDGEPPPIGLPEKLCNEYGYRLYSARYGNIYTVRQLLQLLKEALGIIAPEDYIWIDNEGKYRDAFRPNIEPQGFQHADDVMLSRRRHLEVVEKLFKKLNVFIFTLGLTESWMSKSEGLVYPMAPGTICGKYDSRKYGFHNFNYHETLIDFLEFKNLLHSINPQEIKFLLTVSPVPLTATASNDHCMVATFHSKSILRAVVGELSILCEDIDYFPSYEIISNPWMQQSFYSDNLRTVTKDGVDTVMKIFLRSQAAEKNQSMQPVDVPANTVTDSDEVICEQALLDSFSKNA